MTYYIDWGGSLNSILYEAWNACEGDWKRSRFLQSIKERHSNRKRGVRKWLLAAEMNTMFGEEVAQLMRDRKLSDDKLMEKEVRNHPELPEKEDWPITVSCFIFFCRS